VVAAAAVLALLILGSLLYFPSVFSGISIVDYGQPILSVATTSTATANLSQGLRLDLQLQTVSSGGLTVRVYEFNTLNSARNVTAGNAWRYTPEIVAAFSGCGGAALYQGWTSILGGPAIFAVLRGYYDLNNYTTGQPLTLYNTTYQSTGCPGYPVQYYSFGATNASGISDTVKGYWTGGQDRGRPAAFNRFSPGTYTVVAMDAWGRALALHFEAK
jgi:hypothetical protein